MPSTKDPFGEDVLLLYPSYAAKYHGFPENVDAPIVKGVVNQLGRWPADLLCAFLAVCLIISSLILLTFVTVAVCLPTVIGNRVEGNKAFDVHESSNVYFLKLAHRDWSTTEFCYIETAARKHPDLHFYLINLLKEELVEKHLDDVIKTKTDSDSKVNESFANNPDSLKTTGDYIRERLRIEIPNIQAVDLTVGRLFNGSKLSQVANGLNDDLLELAAKAQLLWTVPGIAVKPSMFCALDTVKRLLCKFVPPVEELCIWNNAFANFQRCWKDYHYRRQHATTEIKEKLFATRKKLLSKENVAQGLNITVGKLKARQPLDKSNSRILVKSTLDANDDPVKNELPDMTG